MEPKDIKEIKTIIDLMKKNDLSVFEIEKEGFRLKLQRGGSGQAAPVAAPAVAGQSKTPAASAEAAPVVPKTIETVQLKEIISPMVGTFYRASQPGAPPFVEEDGAVASGQTLCILEAMKLMNEIKAEVDGIVRRIHVGNGDAVEFGQLLFELEPLPGRPLV